MIRMNLGLSLLALPLVAGATTTGAAGPAPSAEISAQAAPPRPSRVERRGFSVPLPGGWVEVNSEAAVKLTGELGAALAKPSTPATPERRLHPANIVIRHIARMDVDPTQADPCVKTGTGLARVLQSTVQTALVVTTVPASQPTCQIQLVGTEDPNRLSRVTILAAPGNNYLVTCHSDARDPLGAQGCDEALGGFAFKPFTAPAKSVPTAADGGAGGGLRGPDGGPSGRVDGGR